MKLIHAKTIIYMFLIPAIGCSPDADRRTAAHENDDSSATNSQSDRLDIKDFPLYCLTNRTDVNINEVRLKLMGELEALSKRQSDRQSIYNICRRGDVKALSKLLESNPELVNYQEEPQKQTPLYHSADSRQDEVTKYLIAKGANVNLRTKYGVTALHLAAFRIDAMAVRLLLEAGSEVNAQSSLPGKETPLDYAIEGAENRELARQTPPESIWNYVPKTPEQLRAEDEELKQVLELLKAHGAKRASELADKKNE